MCVYLPTKFQVSSVILKRFKQGGALPPPPTAKRTPKKPPKVELRRKIFMT